MQNATALKLLGQNIILSKMLQRCAALKTLSWNITLLLHSLQGQITLLNNNFSWKDNKGVELDNYLLTLASGEHNEPHLQASTKQTF